MKDIIERFNNGEKDALKELYNKAARMIFSYGYIMTKNSFDAEKVLEDTMIEISRSAYKYNHREKPIVWILRIAGKCALNMINDGELQNDINTPEYLEMINDNEAVLTDEILGLLKNCSLEERQRILLKSYSILSEWDIFRITGKLSMTVNKDTEKINILNDIEQLRMPACEAIISKCYEPNNEEYKKSKERKRFYKKVSLITITLSAFIMIVIVPFYINKQTEYRKALQYFEEIHLVSDDLSKDEVISVYNDIVFKNFKLEMTEDIVKKSVINAGENGEMVIVQNGVNTKGLFESLVDKQYAERDGVFYVKDDGYVTENSQYNTTLSKYKDEELLWRSGESSFEFGATGGYKEWDDNLLIIYGQTRKIYDYQATEAYVSCSIFEGGGSTGFTTQIESEYSEEFGDIVVNGDTISIFTKAGESYIHCTEMDKNGNVVFSMIDYSSNSGVYSASAYKDGYIVLDSKSGPASLTIVGKNYISIDNIVFGDKSQENYVIESVLEFNGNLYMSGYVMNNNKEEIDEILTLRDKADMEKLARAHRKQYCAKLWMYDEENDSLLEIYSVGGAKGAKMSIDKSSNLVWDVDGLEECVYVGGSTTTYRENYIVYKYEINRENQLIKKIETDDTKQILN